MAQGKKAWHIARWSEQTVVGPRQGLIQGTMLSAIGFTTNRTSL
jgi:hypothetical protein